MYTIKLASLEEFHLPSLRDFWTYCWRLLSNCSVLAVWSNLNQQPIHSHLPHQRGSCKQISPTFVIYPASFLNAVFPLFCWILNYATWSIWQDSNLRNSACKADALVTRLHKSIKGEGFRSMDLCGLFACNLSYANNRVHFTKRSISC